MEEKLRSNMMSSDIWLRAVYMVLFAIAFSITKLIITVLVIFQFISILVTSRANEQLLQFGKNLSVYVLEILDFQTFNTERRPFPFSPWPDEEPGGDDWLDDDDLDDDDYVAEASDTEPDEEKPARENDETGDPSDQDDTDDEKH